MWGLTVFLCCVWAISLLYGEMLAYWVPLWSCSWPPLTLDATTNSSSTNASDQVRVVVLADPQLFHALGTSMSKETYEAFLHSFKLGNLFQLMDRTSNGLSSGSLALEAAQFYTDIYMRRSFYSSVLPFKPDLVLFLGDMFDGGPFLSDQEWQESMNRFKHIFGLNEHRRKSYSAVYYLSGNHDIGYSRVHSLFPKVIRRYENEFGARNYRFFAGNVEFIVVDAQTLDGPRHGDLTSLSWGFIRNVSNATSTPRVLLLHIPLYRPDGTPCGPYRSSPIINQRVSRAGPEQDIVYQNYLSKETSDSLLDAVKPVLILSGHDHDQCTVIHSTPFGPVKEHTLGTFSWQQGNLYPSFMLLSATSLSSSNAIGSTAVVSTHLCFLPLQTHIYIWYLAQFVVTLLLLIVWPTNGFDFFAHCTHAITRIGRNFLTTSKEKEEENDCEYEMIWDAEGSMHLVKKASKKVQPTKLDVGSVGRGNAVVRPAARKNVASEQEASVSLEMNTDLKLVNTGKQLRPSKSKMKRLIQRVIRVLRSAVVIAAVNVPIYMMLLFKDWI